MAHVYNRGSKHDPKWYVRYRDVDGRWVSRPCHQPTKALAEAFAHQIAARISAGKVGIETPEKELPCRALMEEWSASLTNRNARDDRSRLARHLLPVFGEKALKNITLPTIMRWLDRMKADGKLALRAPVVLDRGFRRAWTVDSGVRGPRIPALAIQAQHRASAADLARLQQALCKDTCVRR